VIKPVYPLNTGCYSKGCPECLGLLRTYLKSYHKVADVKIKPRTFICFGKRIRKAFQFWLVQVGEIFPDMREILPVKMSSPTYLQKKIIPLKCH